jgi:hypothetical protein
MKIHNVTQGTEDWFAVRRGKMTASHAQAIATGGKGLDTYIIKILAEMFSSADKEHFSNEHTDRGNELEEYAREIYEMEIGNKISKVGFIEVDEYSGCSPDGLIGKSGGIEIKCLSDQKYVEFLLNQKIDSAHMWQMQKCMLDTKRDWWDYVVYNPNFKKSLSVKTVYNDDGMIEKLTKGLKIGKQKLKDGIKFFSN